MWKVFALFLIVYVIIASIFTGYISNIVSVKNTNDVRNNFNSISLGDLQPFKTKRESEKVKMIMGNAYHHLLIFLQVSDMHLSKFQDPSRIEAFREFCNLTVPVVNPAVVIASGDLTDGKYDDGVRTNQFEEEWIDYRKALQDSGVVDKTLWLDMRGNHDNFNVHSGTEGFYANYSVQAKKHKGGYMYTIVPQTESRSRDPSEKYSFIGVDASLSPGPKAPWNFYGKVETEEYLRLIQFEKESQSSNGTIWFGHYPTSFIVTPKGQINIRDLMKNAAAYLCGHLHTAYGLVDKMYTFQHSGLLELELADFKKNRRIRVAAFDHGLFAFVDVTHNQWPIILITNPKNVLFNNPIDLDIAQKSSHIRVLVFSPSKITFVKIKIDNEKWTFGDHIEGPLYVTEWNATKYQTGIHKISVFAINKDGEEQLTSHHFSFDSTMSFSFLGRLALMIDAVWLPYALYLGTSIMTVLPFIGLRVVHSLVKNNRVPFRVITKGLGRCGMAFLRMLWITATVNKLFFPLVIAPIYMPIGPRFFGNLLDNSKGIAFAWGTFVENTHLPASFGYVFEGCLQLAWFQIPFVITLCYTVDRKFRKICWKEELSILWTIAPLILLAIFQIGVAKAVYIQTGFPILYLGDLKLFSMIYGTLLWFFAIKLRRIHFLEAEKVWKHPYNVSGSGSRRFLPGNANLQNGNSPNDDTDEHDS